jgi:hypothetical protein
MADIEVTLAERGKRYGRFMDHANTTVQLKQVVSRALDNLHYNKLAADQQEALDMICHKIGRIVCGDPDYADSWIDIAGYAKLVANRLEEESTNKHVVVNKRSDNISLGTGGTSTISYSTHALDKKELFTPNHALSTSQ